MFIRLWRYLRNMGRLIKLLCFVLFLISFLGLFVSAQTTCVADDRIMRISAPTNALGEIWSVGTPAYTQDICYSSIFGQPYAGARANTNAVHDCLPISSPTNKVVRLSGSTGTNAHAEIPTGTAYSINVCYGDLSCQSVAGNVNCPDSTREVVSLSGATNAHIENYSMNSYNTNSNHRKICCSTAGAIPFGISNPQWSYYDGSAYSNGRICPNSYAIMNATISGLSGNVGFELWDDDGPTVLGVNPDDLIWPTAGNVFQGTISNNQVNVTLNLSNSTIRNELQAALTSEGGPLELYFIARQTTYSSPESSQLSYNGSENYCTYSRPGASVTAPVHRGIYFNNTPISFVSGCTSQIGPVQSEWTITRGGTNIYTSTQSQFYYTFTNPGQATIGLRCTINGATSFAEAQILVVASPYTLAYINAPALNSFVYNTPVNPYFPQSVSFSAADSFTVNSIPGTPCPTVQCLGGDCPNQTQNSPASCGGGSITVSNVPSTPSYAGLNFNWRFWDNNWNNEWTAYEGDGVKQGTILYDDMSNTVNDKHMSVRVTHANGATADFQRDFTLGRCLNNGNTYYSPTSQVLSTSIGVENNACKGVDNAPNTGDDCCSVGLTCMDPDSDNSFSCEMPSNVVTRCGEFTNQTACNSNRNPAIPLASYPGASMCTFLQCYWTSAGSCAVRATQYNYTSAGCNTSGPGSCISDCAWTTTQTECLNGRKTISYTGEVISSGSLCPSTPALCNRSPVPVPCGSLNFELSFFGTAQFIVSAIAIAVLYVLFSIYRGKWHERKS